MAKSKIRSFICGMLLLLLCSVILCCQSRLYYYAQGTYSRMWCNSMFLLFIVIFGYVLFTIISSYFFKDVKLLPDDELPGCTVIVPAYNEGQHVATTLVSLLNANYPEDKLEIIAVNDGSKDDTLQWMHSIADKYPNRVKIIDLKVNGGKKNALCQGFKQAKYDLVATVDSDSEVNPEALKALVSGFQEPGVGAVAGNIRVDNINDGLIPRLMDIGFLFMFATIRTTQSISKCVLCTPGALSAYRRAAVMPILDRWQKQTFLGVEARIGEDRALATLILMQGYGIIYADKAVAMTKIPSQYVTFCKMMLRWTRSDLRENLRLLGWLLHFPGATRQVFGTWLHNMLAIINTTMMICALPVIVSTIVILSSGCLEQLTLTIVLFLAWGSLPAVFYANKRSITGALWAYVFSIFNLFCISWIPFWSLITVRNNHWMTRKPKKQTFPAVVQE